MNDENSKKREEDSLLFKILGKVLSDKPLIFTEFQKHDIVISFIVVFFIAIIIITLALSIFVFKIPIKKAFNMLSNIYFIAIGLIVVVVCLYCMISQLKYTKKVKAVFARFDDNGEYMVAIYEYLYNGITYTREGVSIKKYNNLNFEANIQSVVREKKLKINPKDPSQYTDTSGLALAFVTLLFGLIFIYLGFAFF